MVMVSGRAKVSLLQLGGGDDGDGDDNDDDDDEDDDDDNNHAGEDDGNGVRPAHCQQHTSAEHNQGSFCIKDIK